MSNLDSYINQISEIFSEEERRVAHQQIGPLLEEMAASKEILFEAIERNLSNREFWESKRINPVVAFPIFEDEKVTLVAHAFVNRPDARTDLSHQSIHHHGNLLLSTVNCFGEGYESILFKKGYQLEPNRADLEVDKVYVNQFGECEFIDSYSPHIVFYPQKLTITYALWSSESKQGTDKLKKIEWLRKYKKGLRKLIQGVRLEKLFNLNRIEYMDFYVEHNQIVPLKERIRYPEASHKSFIHGLLFVLQEIGFSKAKIKETAAPYLANAEAEIKELFEKNLADCGLDPEHLLIPKVNLDRKDLFEVLNLS